MTALQVYALLFNGTGVIYIVNDASVLGDTTKVPSFDKGFDNIDDYRGRVAKACAYNAQLLGDRALRIYLDPRPLGVGPGNSKYDVLDINPAKAVDITDVITVKGLQEPPETITTVVSANEVTFQRMSSRTILYVDGGAPFPANVVNTFSPVGAEVGDTVTIYGINGGTPVILDTTAFNYLELQTTLSSYSDSVTLSLTPAGWNQIVPNKMDAAALRNQGVPISLQPGVFTFQPAGGTATIRPGAIGSSGPFPGDVFEPNIALSGVPAVLAASLNFFVDVTNAIPGDSGVILGDSIAVTVGANAINFSDLGGIKSTIPAQLALTGKWSVQWTVVSVVAGLENVQFTITPDFGTSNTQFLETAMYQDLSVTNDKLADGVIVGSTKLADGSVTEVKLDDIVQYKLNAQGRYIQRVAIPTGEILALNTTPILAVQAPGVGKAIVVESVTAQITYIAPVYATNVNLQLIFDTATAPIMESSTILVKTTNAIVNLPLSATVAAGETQILENTALYFTVETGDPTAGASNFVFYVEYMILNL